MWVATNRQKPPEDNAFAKRARMKRGEPADGALAATPEEAPEPAEVADRMPDLQALREAADKAAQLIPAAAPFDRNPASEEYTQAADIAQYEPEARRGRKADPAVSARTARVLQALREAEQVGIAKPDLAALVGEKEAQVYTSLRQLQKEGKVETRFVPEIKGHRWFAL